MKLYKCRFIIRWIDESDGACGETTGIHTKDDLIKAADGDESKQLYSVYEYEAPIDFAWEIGSSYAFKEDWTATDSLSIIQVQDDNGVWGDCGEIISGIW